MPWCLWPIVGCERRCEPRAETGRKGWRPPCRAAGAAPDRFRETVHGRASETRWPNCRPWFVKLLISLFSLAEHCVILLSLWSYNKIVGTIRGSLLAFALQFVLLDSYKEYAEFRPTFGVGVKHVKCLRISVSYDTIKVSAHVGQLTINRIS